MFRRLLIKALDIVIIPLVAFDLNGYRLGMGGGYYDKVFAFKKTHPTPKLVGLAYDFQKITDTPHNELDTRLDEVITEKQRYLFHPAS